MSVTLNGYERVLAWVKGRSSQYKTRLSALVFLEALEIMAESKKIVPVMTGALRASGRVEPPRNRGGDVSVLMSYGGSAAPYAFKVHEDTDARRKPGQQAKFLEEPARKHLATFAARLKAALKG